MESASEFGELGAGYADVAQRLIPSQALDFESRRVVGFRAQHDAQAIQIDIHTLTLRPDRVDPGGGAVGSAAPLLTGGGES